jgi:phosphoserine aminotransferase
MLDYRTHIHGEDGMFNTPPVFPIYIMFQTLQWIQSVGGMEVMNKMNIEKAALLYHEIDRNPLFVGTAAKEDRSIMNICFVMTDEYKNKETAFLEFAKANNIVGIKGHRSVGGFRASTYNALPKESVQTLVNCMQEFEKRAL